MSFSNIRQRTHAAAQPDDEGNPNCQASNCPRRGTISLGGNKFFCDAHAFADAEKWPRITEALRNNDWLIEFHDDLQKMDRKSEDWRAFATQFWQGQEDGELLAPQPKEGAVPYMNRMRSELTYRCGLNKRPAARLPQEVKVRGSSVKGKAL